MVEGTYSFAGLASSSTAGDTAAEATKTEGQTSAAEGTAAPAQETAEPDKADTATLESIMGGAGTETEPETKPDEKSEGKKDEGKEEEPAAKPAWMSQLPEELRGDESLANFQKLGDLAKAWKELSAKAQGPEIPGKDAKPEELEAFYSRLGKPKDAKGYKLEGENLDAFKELAFKSNLTQDQAAAVLKSLKDAGNQFMSQRTDNMKKMYADTDHQLRTEFGSQYGERMQTLSKGLMTFGGKNVQQKLLNAGLSFDPDIIHMFIKLGDMVKESQSSGKQSAAQGYKSNADGGHFTFKGL